MRIASIPIHPIDHNLDLVVRQEALRLVRVFWKVHKKNKTDDNDDDGDNPFSDKDPLPPGMALHPVHLL
jgi:hypothetical protein